MSATTYNIAIEWAGTLHIDYHPAMASRARRSADKDPSPRRARFRRRLAVAGIGATAGVLGLWIAVNRVEWLGPIVADSLRAIVGTRAVAALEEFAYRQQDRFNRLWRRGEQPRAYWEVPELPPEAAPHEAATDGEAPSPDPLPPFRPKDVGPVHDSWSAPGDGIWVPIVDPARRDAEPYMMKTLLHPDKRRSWAEVFVVAIDLRRVHVHLVPGSREPVATEEEAEELERPGRIPDEHHEHALAAFNGGFKTEHGQYGMYAAGVTLVAPQQGVCAIARYEDESIRIATWDKLEDQQERMVWWRQTPNCMYEDGELHPRLQSELLAKKWGATLDGETVIRRSAIGISEDANILYMSITNHTTARVIADGVRHAGAVTVAQLDVNFSYPKFVIFEPEKEPENPERPKRIATALADGFEFSEDEYIRKPARRDFFYLMPKDADGRTARSPAEQ